MEQKDYSLEIYDNYYNSKGKILKITLKNDSVLEGILVGFYHGSDGKSIDRWHFVKTDEIEKYQIAMDKQEVGTLINQEDIKSVSFVKHE